MIELRPIGASVTAQQTAVVTTRPPDRKRTLATLAALAVVGLLAFGLVKTFGDDSTEEATSPTSTVTPTTTIEATTTVPPTTAATATTAPTTTAPRATTTAAPPVTTTIPYVNQRRGSVLDAAQNAQSIYFVSGSDLVRIELGTGLVTTKRLAAPVVGYGLIGVSDGRVFLNGVNGRTVSWIAGDLSGEVTSIDTGNFFGLNGPTSVTRDGVWVVRTAEEVAGSPVVRLLDLKGQVRAEVRLPAGTYPAGYLGERVVVSQFGRIWTVGVDGVPVPYAVGQLVAANSGLVLWVSCDDGARCTFRLGDASQPDLGRTSLETSYLAAWGTGEGGMAWNALSPDAATVVGTVFVDRSNVRQRIVDLATGATIDLDGTGYTNFAWTPDGGWLIETTPSGSLVATNVRTGRKVTLSIPQGTAPRNGGVGIFVG
jgi:hypothetical protein